MKVQSLNDIVEIYADHTTGMGMNIGPKWKINAKNSPDHLEFDGKSGKKIYFDKEAKIGIDVPQPLAPLHVKGGLGDNEIVRVEGSGPDFTQQRFYHDGNYVGYIYAKHISGGDKIFKIGAKHPTGGTEYDLVLDGKIIIIKSLLHLKGGSEDNEIIRVEGSGDNFAQQRFYHNNKYVGYIYAKNIRSGPSADRGQWLKIAATSSSTAPASEKHDLILDGKEIHLNAPVKGLSVTVDYNACTSKEILNQAGGPHGAGDTWKAQCPSNKVLVGIYDPGASQTFGHINRIKCCKLKVS